MSTSMDAPSSAAKGSNICWADLEDKEEDLAFLLPPTEVIGPDEKGIKKAIQYKFDEAGNKVKVTSIYRVRKLRLTKRAIERRQWAKFGDALDDDANNRLTVVSTEKIFLDRPGAKGKEAEDANAGKDASGQLGQEGAILMVCRICNKRGEHWTAKCPYKDLAPQSESSNERPPSADGSESSSEDKKKAYVPPRMREGGHRSGGRADMRNRDNEHTLRISNLTEEAEDSDLRDLFGAFGPITRAYAAVDRLTGWKRGLGFVAFVNKEDAEKAICKLNGYGYGNLILKVEWSMSRSN